VPQNFTERAYKLLSSFGNLFSKLDNIFSKLDNIFSRLENNYITSLKDFYAVLWGALYRVSR
jgi:phage-related protein